MLKKLFMISRKLCTIGIKTLRGIYEGQPKFDESFNKFIVKTIRNSSMLAELKASGHG